MRIAFAALAVLVVALTPGPAAGSGGTPVFAGYWAGFVDHWSAYFQKQSGVVLIALAVAAASLFIITRGKWRK